MKICLFNVTSTMAPIGSEEVGGVEAYTFRLGEALAERGHCVFLFGGKPAEEMALPKTPMDLHLSSFLETRKVPNLGTRFQRLVQRLHFAHFNQKDFLRENFDAVMIFKPYDFITAWLWKKKGFRGRVVASLHGTEFYFGDRFFSKAVDALYGVSPQVAHLLEGRYHRPCGVIPNFINGQRFCFLERPRPPREKIILSAGRLVPIKGMDFLIKVFAKTRSRIPDAKLCLIGEGPERPKLEDLISRLKLGESVRLTGLLGEKELLERHGQCWVYVQPSIGEETFSLSALEAFASGLRVISSDRVHVARVFQPEGAVELYPAQDATALEKLLVQALSEDWSENQRRGQKGRRVVEKQFLAEKIAPKIEKLLKKQETPSNPAQAKGVKAEG